MYTAVYVEVWINGDTHDEVMSDIGVKQGCPSPPNYSACTLMNLEPIWMSSMGILHAYLAKWLSFFFMPMMLFYSLDHPQAYKDFWMS